MANGQRLTAAKVKQLVTKGPAGKHGDGGGGHGLVLLVPERGNPRWIQRIRMPTEGVKYGKVRDIPLGPAAEITLAAARDMAAANHKAAKRGRSAAPTFAQAMEKVIALKRWRGEQAEDKWRASLANHAADLLNRPIDQIKGGDVMDCLDPIWQSKPETARRVRQRISAIMDWAVANEHREYNPVVAVAKAMPKQAKRCVHYRALPHAEVAGAIAKVRATGYQAAIKLAFEFQILTAARPGEARGAVWAEIDLEAAVWTIPGVRMKAEREHRVPLSPRALELLREARRLHGGDLVFPSTAGRPIHATTMIGMLRDLGIDAVPHGFRSSFRNWAGELSGASHEACERALAHTVRNAAEAAYNRTDLLDQRRQLMDDWAAYLAG